MAIDFTLTKEQQEIQADGARASPRTCSRRSSRQVDEEPDPLHGFQLTKPAYAEACKRGIAFSHAAQASTAAAACPTSTS